MKKKTEKMKAYSFETLTSASTINKEVMKKIKAGEACVPKDGHRGGACKPQEG